MKEHTCGHLLAAFTILICPKAGAPVRRSRHNTIQSTRRIFFYSLLFMVTWNLAVKA